jgi:hypothetical protein
LCAGKANLANEDVDLATNHGGGAPKCAAWTA